MSCDTLNNCCWTICEKIGKKRKEETIFAEALVIRKLVSQHVIVVYYNFITIIEVRDNKIVTARANYVLDLSNLFVAVYFHVWTTFYQLENVHLWRCISGSITEEKEKEESSRKIAAVFSHFFLWQQSKKKEKRKRRRRKVFSKCIFIRSHNWNLFQIY